MQEFIIYMEQYISVEEFQFICFLSGSLILFFISMFIMLKVEKQYTLNEYIKKILENSEEEKIVKNKIKREIDKIINENYKHITN